MKLLKNLCTLIVSLPLMACASLSGPLTQRDSPPSESLAKCPDIEKDGHYRNFGEVLEKLTEVIGMYNDCSVRHNGLVDYEKGKK